MFVVLNHKMNLTLEEMKEYQRQLQSRKYQDTLIVCPAMPYLALLQGENYDLGSQDVSMYTAVNHTGDVSARQLRSINVTYALVGHSERRANYKEDALCIREKMKRLLEQEIHPILCIGETQKEHETGQVQEVLEKEIHEAFETLPKEEIKNVIIAYEPIFSIGTGQVMSNQQIEQVVTSVKALLKDTYQVDLPVLYGGSINDNNFERLKEISNLDGFLIGGFSLQIEALQKLLP